VADHGRAHSTGARGAAAASEAAPGSTRQGRRRGRSLASWIEDDEPRAAPFYTTVDRRTGRVIRQTASRQAAEAERGARLCRRRSDQDARLSQFRTAPVRLPLTIHRHRPPSLAGNSRIPLARASVVDEGGFAGFRRRPPLSISVNTTNPDPADWQDLNTAGQPAADASLIERAGSGASDSRNAGAVNIGQGRKPDLSAVDAGTP